MDTSRLGRPVTPGEWAAKVVGRSSDDDVLGPGGRLALAKLASRGPAWLLDSLSGADLQARRR